jgi:hypothetical protein
MSKKLSKKDLKQLLKDERKDREILHTSFRNMLTRAVELEKEQAVYRAARAKYAKFFETLKTEAIAKWQKN